MDAIVAVGAMASKERIPQAYPLNALPEYVPTSKASAGVTPHASNCQIPVGGRVFPGDGSMRSKISARSQGRVQGVIVNLFLWMRAERTACGLGESERNPQLKKNTS